jgi:RNA-binding protein YhbY
MGPLLAEVRRHLEQEELVAVEVLEIREDGRLGG